MAQLSRLRAQSLVEADPLLSNSLEEVESDALLSTCRRKRPYGLGLSSRFFEEVESDALLFTIQEEELMA